MKKNDDDKKGDFQTEDVINRDDIYDRIFILIGMTTKIRKIVISMTKLMLTTMKHHLNYYDKKR
jgi:hypothetical protein